MAEFKWFDYYPEGTFTMRGGPRSSPLVWALVVALTLLAWFGIATPIPMKTIGVYAILGVVSLVWLIIEGNFPERTTYIASVGLRPGEGKLDETVLTGVGIGVAVLLTGNLAGVWAISPFQLEVQTVLKAMTAGMGVLFLTVVVVIIEESFFNACLAPSFAEQAGVATAVVSSAFAFFAFHFVSWFPITLLGLGILGGFRALATLAMVEYRSAVPGLIGHFMINLTALGLVLG